MRVTRLMLATLRDTPANAEIASHQLLARGGYIRRVSAGIYAYMPLLWRVLSKITNIVQQEMDQAEALQTLLPQLHPSELWESSGRWKGYTAGEGIMFHLKDRQGRELGLGPTHEEVVTKIIGEQIRSYKQLPINIYQIQTKFRDEIRPRFGLMRSREFIMKDAYSFHSNELDLKKTYSKMNETYSRIFRRCGIETVKVDADSGAIGGSASQEFMVTAESGEDLILKSKNGEYAANAEKAVSRPSKAKILPKKESITLETKNQKSIDSLCKNHSLDSSQIVKVILMLAVLEDAKDQPVMISIRGDQEINEVKLINIISNQMNQKVIKLTNIKEDQIKSQGIDSIPFGFIGPDIDDQVLTKTKTWNKSFLRLIDKTAADLESFVCGSNIENYHRFYVNWSINKFSSEIVDIRIAKAGDSLINNQSLKLEESRGIEVGHIFQLGQKYSKALNATFTDEKGIEQPFWMGCYGIGISRLAQAAVEQHHDDLGIVWPISIAPYEVIISIANVEDENQNSLGEKIYSKLKSLGIEALLDDRKERAGVKFKDADLIGIPWRIVVGRDASLEKVELIERSKKTKEILGTKKTLEKLLNEISKQKAF